MAIKKTGVLALLAIVLFALFILILFIPNALATATLVGVESLLIRFLGLYGFIFIGITALTTPFLAGITIAFGRPFKKIHHTFAAVGIALITLHPVFSALQLMNLDVFLPKFTSWAIFWTLAGRPALYILYIGVAAALFSRKIPKYWRIFHVLVYLVLFFGIIHANLLGEDFANLGIRLALDGIFVASMVGLVYKRFRIYQARKRMLLLKKTRS